MENSSKIVPVSVITGFLGSGKTTFLNYILTQSHGKKIAIIQNEFGEALKLETAMVVGSEGDRVNEWLELPNGCICCSVKGTLASTLENLVSRKKNELDYIFIEPTGIADPGPLAASLWVDDELEGNIYLDAVITIVDGKFFLPSLSECSKSSLHSDGKNNINEAQRQVAFADVLLINKCDLISEAEQSELEKTLKKINSIAPMIRTIRSEVPLNKILDLRSFDMNQILKVDPSLSENDNSQKKCNLDHDHKDCSKENSVSTICLDIEMPTTVDLLTGWFAKLFWEDNDDESKPTILRVKGMANILDSNEKYIIQGVHNNFDIQPSGIQWKQDDQKRTNKIVIIGKNLDKPSFTASFTSMCKQTQ